MSSMWRVSCALVYIVVGVKPSLITQATNPGLLRSEENEVDLGSYDGKVHIGELPGLYKLTDEDKSASESAVEILERLRPLFPTGILSVPPLDPYKTNNIKPIIIPEEVSPLLTGKIEIREVLLQGGKLFNLKLLQLRLKNDPRADFDVDIPALYGHVILNADLRLGGMLPIKLNSKINFHIKGISVHGAVSAGKISYEGMEVYQLQNLHANIHADEVNVGLRGVGKSIIQDILRFTKKANLQNAPSIETTKILINNHVAKAALEEVNKILRGFSVNLIESFLQS